MLVLGSNEWAIYDGVRVCDHIWAVVLYSNVRAENVATLAESPFFAVSSYCCLHWGRGAVTAWLLGWRCVL